VVARCEYELPGREASGRGRRIVKKVGHSGDWDNTYHYYWDGQQMVETRNGLDQVLKQHVWGRQYVDELVQIAMNQDPENAGEGEYDENVCERFFWVMQDANYNVLGVATAAGVLIERYEYTPYGQRTVYSHGWSPADFDNDGDVDGDDTTLFMAAYNMWRRSAAARKAPTASTTSAATARSTVTTPRRTTRTSTRP